MYEKYRNEEGDVETIFNEYPAEKLELIPHPDTVRLDFILKNQYLPVPSNGGGIEIIKHHGSADFDSIENAPEKMRELLDRLIAKEEQQSWEISTEDD